MLCLNAIFCSGRASPSCGDFGFCAVRQLVWARIRLRICVSIERDINAQRTTIVSQGRQGAASLCGLHIDDRIENPGD